MINRKDYGLVSAGACGYTSLKKEDYIE